jgi:hypothetical protein
MAKKKNGMNGEQKGETIQGYFRNVFKESPKLLKAKSNQELLERWLADHPDAKEVPKAVKVGLANTKSVLRSKRRKRKAAKMDEAAPAAAETAMHVAETPTPRRRSSLPELEEAIDDTMTLAKNLDREGLVSVIGLLRRARNEVVWKMGE